MSIEQLETNLDIIKKKYSTMQNEVLNYYYDIEDTLYNYGEETNNFEPVNNFIHNIVDGLSLFGEDYCNEVCDVSSDLYYFKSFDDIEEVDYNFINKLIDNSLAKVKNEKDFEIC